MRRVTVLALSLALSFPAAADVLLIPDSAGDKIWAFDPFDGSVLSDNYIPADGQMVQPINVVDSGRGTLLVSDENADAILEYDFTGRFLGAVADATSGLDALQGLTVFDGAAYVGSRTARVIYRVDLNTGAVDVWAPMNAGTPRDIGFRPNDALTTNSDSQSNGGENLERFDLAGNFLGTFHDSDGVNGIDFPQQLQLLSKGDVLAAGFTSPRGLYVYDSQGNQLQAYTNIITSPRGVYPLGNGKLLYAGGTRVMCYDPQTLTETTIVNQSGTSFRYVERSIAPPPIFGDVNRDGLIDVRDLVAIATSFGPCTTANCLADLNGDGLISVLDLLILQNLLGRGPKNGGPKATF